MGSGLSTPNNNHSHERRNKLVSSFASAPSLSPRPNLLEGTAMTVIRHSRTDENNSNYAILKGAGKDRGTALG